VSDETSAHAGSHSGTNHYAELKRLMKENRLLDRQPAYYAGKSALTIGLLAVSLTLLLVLNSRGSNS
jgi:hypothetical protein